MQNLNIIASYTVRWGEAGIMEDCHGFEAMQSTDSQDLYSAVISSLSLARCERNIVTFRIGHSQFSLPQTGS